MSGNCSPVPRHTHPVEESDVDDPGVQGASAGVVDRGRTGAADQAEQPGGRAHLRPGQWMLEHRGNVGANVFVMCGCFALQRIQIPHRIDGQLTGQIGGAAARTHQRVDVRRTHCRIGRTPAG
jgi:hypothetical protein